MRKLTLILVTILGIVLFIYYIWLYSPFFFGTFILLLFPGFSFVIRGLPKSDRMRYYIILSIVFIVFLTLLIYFPSLNYFINKHQTLS